MHKTGSNSSIQISQHLSKNVLNQKITGIIIADDLLNDVEIHLENGKAFKISITDIDLDLSDRIFPVKGLSK